MNNFITDLEISNFKSIKNIKMDCKRINVLIGKPNVGKSNILEALSLYVTPYAKHGAKFLQDYVRYEKLSNLFYDSDRRNQITIQSNLGFATLRFHLNAINQYDIILAPEIEILNSMNQQDTGNNLNEKGKFFARLIEDRKINAFSHTIQPFYASIGENAQMHLHYGDNIGYKTPIRQYHFKSISEHKNHFASFLLPPFGDNLYTILEGNPLLWEEIAGLFNNYGLDLILDTEEEKLSIQKKIGRRVTKIPYPLVADTLQRFIFHLAAIETNNGSILLLEEPESHSYPPYVSLLAERIIANKQNQFFIATHSPYLLTPFIEQCPRDEIAIFIARYENYETKVRALREEEIQEIMDEQIDLFYNIRAFQE